MNNKNFTDRLHQYAQSQQGTEYPQTQGFADGYQQAIMDFKEIMQEQEGKGYKSIKVSLWNKVNTDLLAIEVFQSYGNASCVVKPVASRFHIKFVFDPTGVDPHTFEKEMAFLPTVGQILYWLWEDYDGPFIIKEVHLAFADDGIHNFDGIWCWLEQTD